jgi:starch synthase (maltosyl-transferring)
MSIETACRIPHEGIARIPGLCATFPMEAAIVNSAKTDLEGPRLVLRRVVIEGLEPEIDAGKYPIKRTVGERVVVKADIHADGHEVLGAVVLYRPERESAWSEAVMHPLQNDRWSGQFSVNSLGTYLYTVQAWVDPFQSWRRDTVKKSEAGQDVSVAALSGARLVQSAANRARGTDSQRLGEFAAELKSLSSAGREAVVSCAETAELAALMGRYIDRSRASTYDKQLGVVVEREKARYSTWYEMFPRSCASEPNKHGTFRDCIQRLRYVSEMGFDVLYFPPIHPIGRTQRKGKNNTTQPSPEDPGSPWAIGADEGGHVAIHPNLGTLEEFKQLQAKARELGIEIALDLAFQCSPDHPYVKGHKEWFLERPDGSVQYAENPPKKYEDIYPFYFESEYASELCEELKRVVLYWIKQGVHIFRVDNPHTKPFDFWEWLIKEVRREYPEVIFLSEAFTRPKVMHRLAKLGFAQSYTYFAWKNTKWELTEYFTELTQAPVREFLRPNVWPNTPDILTEYLQYGGRPAFMSRLILAATLSANYGIYGPAFELCENRSLRQGSEEYLDSEKYQIRAWDIGRPESLKGLVARVNEIRREHPALQSDWSLRFHPLDNDQLIAYSKVTEDLSDIVLVVVNLDPRYKQSGWIELPLEYFELASNQSFQVHDLLTDARYVWQGARNYVELNPLVLPAHIFRVRRRLRTERDFDYFL